MFSSLQQAYAELTETRFELERRGAAVEEARERFEQVVSSMSEALWLLDPSGVVVTANARAGDLLGHSAHDLAGHDFAELWPGSGIPATPWELLERAPSGTIADVDARIERSGVPIALSISCSLMRDRNGRITGVIVVARDISDRKRTEEAIAVLAEASRTLAQSLDLEPALAQLARAPLPALADCCAVHLREPGGGLRLMGVAGNGEEAAPIERLFTENHEATRALVGRALAARSALVDDRAEIAGTPVASRISVPILMRGEAAGVITLIRGRGRALHVQADVDVAEELARRAAMAIGNAELYATTRSVARTLQRSLLPGELPQPAGVSLAALYLPAVPEPVGGDWYDAFMLPDGRLALALGDVAGHGVPAAGVMGRLRHSLRAYALEGHAPAAVLTRLNQLVEPGEMATLVLAVIEPESTRLTWANAGHLPPLLVGGDRSGELLTGGGPPLGASGSLSYPQFDRPLEKVETLLFYSDGLVERRGERLDQSLSRLVAATPHLRGDNLGEALDALAGGLLGDLRPADDVAVLAARMEPLAGRPLVLSTNAAPAVLAELRRSLRRWMGANGVQSAHAMGILTAVGEACANVVEHAYRGSRGLLELEARRNGRTLVVTVRDHGRWRPRREEGRGRGLDIARVLMDRVTVEESDGTAVRMTKELTPPD